jgi:hypothetical protein
MKITSMLLSVAAAGWLLCGVAVAQYQDEPALVPSEEAYEYETAVQDEKDKAATEKAPAPKAQKSTDKAPKAEKMDKAPKMEKIVPVEETPAADSCGKKNSNGCGKKNGCANDGGCDEEEEHKCDCYLFGPEKAFVLWDHLLGECPEGCEPLFKVAGWTQVGYNNHFDPLSQTRGDLLSYNDVPGNAELHQAWIYAERTPNTKECCWDWGFRGDLVYGTDAQKAQAFGNPPGPPRGWDNEWDHGVYGWAIPQAYASVAYGDLTVSAGHMFTKNGYEVIPATGNFFFTHSLSFFNSEPFTHTGVMGEYKASDDLTLVAGWLLGWDTGFDRFEDGSMWHGGFRYNLTDDIKVSYISCAGDFGNRGKEAYMQTLLLDVTLCKKLNYVLQSDYMRIDKAADGTPLGDDDISIVQYLFYTYNDCLKFGVRGEWWKNDGQSHHVITYGVNYRPHANLIIRPEMKHHWSPATDIREDVFGVDAIVTF